MQTFLETERLVLRRFTEADVDNLVELDSDPEVMRFINGGRPTPRDEIENDVLPAFLGYYERHRRIRLLGRGREVDRALPRLVSFPSPASCPARRGRTRLPATKISVGKGLRHRRLAGVDSEGLRRARCSTRRCIHDGRARRLVARDGEVGPEARKDISPSPGLTTSRVRRKVTSSTRCSGRSGSSRPWRKIESLPTGE